MLCRRRTDPLLGTAHLTWNTLAARAPPSAKDLEGKQAKQFECFADLLESWKSASPAVMKLLVVV
jgi:hypothetical protein